MPIVRPVKALVLLPSLKTPFWDCEITETATCILCFSLPADTPQLKTERALFLGFMAAGLLLSVICALWREGKIVG